MHECITNLKSNIKLVKIYLKPTINAGETVVNSRYETVMPEKETVHKLCIFNSWLAVDLDPKLYSLPLL